jgi:hypothetical protein
MKSSMGNGRDVVAFIKSQHEQVKKMFQAVLAARGPERSKAFIELRRLLAVHETAEEEIVHPAARKVMDNGKQIIDARLQEERAAKEALAVLESLDVDSPEFEIRFGALRASVLSHAESEEREELAALGDRLEAGQLERMGKVVELAEKLAPTRPHPGIESAAANILTGPFAAMVDRARDALQASQHHRH